LIKYERPDLIFHLAAQSHVPTSWKSPWETFENNVRGQLNLFEAIIANQLSPRILVVSSNEVYGAPEGNDDLPFVEQRLLRPANPYGVSKVSQEAMALQYRRSHGLDVVIARPFNHIGPGQKPSFVIAGFARQIAEIEAGKHEPVMGLGNMQAQRDFTDVRDIARAYYSITRYADADNIYNVCSGTPRSIQSIFELMLSMSHAHIDTHTDPSKFRIADTPISYGDNARIRQDIGWQPQIPFEQTIADVLDDWRQRIATDENAGHQQPTTRN
ncbi:MAG: GDP-mannose 4,6-dehydratase, partial [Chloroflexi bacterium]|nr:GDP-mannose 4,6-dehydratase [Chloroflexota bacterium]